MNNKHFAALGIAILVTGAMLLSAGVYLKLAVFGPYGLAEDESIAALPFLYFTDDALRYALEEAKNPTEETTEPTTEPTTIPETTVPASTEESGETVPEDTMPEDTVPDETVPASDPA